jgi:hypothetical protein
MREGSTLPLSALVSTSARSGFAFACQQVPVRARFPHAEPGSVTSDAVPHTPQGEHNQRKLLPRKC